MFRNVTAGSRGTVRRVAATRERGVASAKARVTCRQGSSAHASHTLWRDLPPIHRSAWKGYSAQFVNKGKKEGRSCYAPAREDQDRRRRDALQQGIMASCASTNGGPAGGGLKGLDRWKAKAAPDA